MDISSLPEDGFYKSPKNEGSILIYEYIARQAVIRDKRVLEQNAISLIISGEKTIHFANRTVHINDDEIHFLSAGNCVANMNFSNKKIFRSILVFFDNKSLADFFQKHKEQVLQAKNVIESSPNPFLSFKKDAYINHYIRSLEIACQKGPPLSKPMCLLKFEELMLYLLETYPTQLLSFEGVKKTNLDNIGLRKIMETHVTSAVNLEDLAFLCNISLSTFKRRFALIYGTTPSKWILKRRMEIAKNLLSQSNVRPSDVYWKLGYENHSSFTESFKHTFGITPSAYQTALMETVE